MVPSSIRARREAGVHEYSNAVRTQKREILSLELIVVNMRGAREGGPDINAVDRQNRLGCDI